MTEIAAMAPLSSLDRKSAGGSQPKLTPKTAKGQRRRRELIAAATRALNRVGYRELTVADVVKEAGAPIGLFYRYFRNKSDIVIEALEDVIAEHKARMPTGAATFFDFQVAAHRNLIRLFSEAPGLMGCYYSFDYSEATFAGLFRDQTLDFDRMHAARAIATTVMPEGVTAESLIPLAHALTAMTDNFVFRYCTGRDETAALERAALVDVATLLAQIRVRAFTVTDQGVNLSVLPPALPADPQVQRPQIAALGMDMPTHKRMPKRIDSNASYTALKAAALTLMNRLPHDELRIRDIEDECGVTRGAIYHYFGEKRDLIMLLLRERLAEIHAKLERVAVRPKATAYNDLAAMIGVFLDEYQTNPGIIRTLYSIERDDAEAADLLASYRRVWARAFADLISVHMNAESSRRNVLILVGYAILAMIERFSYDLNILPFPEISTHARSEEQPRFIAAVWVRVLFLAMPETDEFPQTSLLP